jgi:putative ABC transport system substrate-binding protein
VELVALAPDLIVTSGASTTGIVLQVNRTVPVVFVGAADPVAAGFVDSLARPGGNATGFTSYEYSMSAKWLELLKQIAPGVTRVAILRDASQAFAMSMFATIQAVAPARGVEAIPVNMRDASEIEQSVESFARSPNGGLIVTASAGALFHRDLIVQRGTNCPRSTSKAPSPPLAVWCPMGLITSTSIVAQPTTSTAS